MTFKYLLQTADLTWIFSVITCLTLSCILLDILLRRLYIKNIKDKYVLVTGCDTGFGHLAALRLDKLGSRVFAGCLTSAGMAEVAKATSPRLVALCLDVTDDDSVRAALKTVEGILPKTTGFQSTSASLHGLVNNAGVLGKLGPSEWLEEQDYRCLFDVNVFGMLAVTRTFLPLVKRQRGRIVNVTSVLGRLALPYLSPYCMSKYAVEAFSDSLRREVYPFGVSVHIIEPGGHHTPFMDPSRVSRSILESWQNIDDRTRTEYGKDYLKRVIFLGATLMPLVGTSDGDQVAKVYEHALLSRLPRMRYVVGLDAWAMAAASYLPTWICDLIFCLPPLRNIPQASISAAKVK